MPKTQENILQVKELCKKYQLKYYYSKNDFKNRLAKKRNDNAEVVLKTTNIKEEYIKKS